MNLTSLALRIAAAGAIKGATWAGDRVATQPIDPLANLSKEKKPLIAIYTGDSGAEQVRGRDLTSADHFVTLIIQIYLPPRIAVDGVGEIDTTNEFSEVVIEIVGRQIEIALMQSETAWAKIWRDIVFEIVGVNSKPYLIQSDKGPRAVAREVQWSVNTVSSPAFGPPSGVWIDFLAAVETDELSAPMRPLIEAAIRGENMPDWKRAIYSAGMRLAAGRKIGISPADLKAAGEAAPLASIIIDGLAAASVAVDPVTG